MDTYNKESFSSNDSLNSFYTNSSHNNEDRNKNRIENGNNIPNDNENSDVIDDIQNALFDDLSNTHIKHNKDGTIHMESSKNLLEEYQQENHATTNFDNHESENSRIILSKNKIRKINDAEVLKKLFMKSNLSRVRSRFVVPVILFKNKNICRSGTLSLEPEMLLNSLNSKTKEIIYGISR